MHSVYRYEAVFDEPTRLALFANIPFLNGGLFECLDKGPARRQTPDVRVDGFSDRPDNPLHVPDVLFFGDDTTLDLNEIFGTHNKQYKVRGLVDIFNSYKFTIEENTPIEEEIALDPELLGKVFENLLAAYNPETRHDGAQADRLLLHAARDRRLHGGRGADRLSGPPRTAETRLRLHT